MKPGIEAAALHECPCGHSLLSRHICTSPVAHEGLQEDPVRTEAVNDAQQTDPTEQLVVLSQVSRA